MGKFSKNDIERLTEEAREHTDSNGGKGKAEKTSVYSTTFRSPAIVCAYVREKSWHERKSLSATITDIILKDMALPENKEVVDAIDDSSYFWLREGRHKKK